MTVSVSNAVDIRATVAEVMEVIADVESLPQWSKAHVFAEILDKDADGWPLKARTGVKSFGFSDEMLLDYTWYDGEVSWQLAEESKVQKLQNATYTLTDNGDGTTHVVFAIEVDLKTPLPSLVVKKAQKHAAEVATKGLKDETERRYA